MNFLFSVTGNKTLDCGMDMYVPEAFPALIHTIITIIKIVVPILLVIFGMLDMGKAVVAAKEDDIKKGQQTLIKRVIAGLIVFFVIQLVQLLIGFVSDKDSATLRCFNCFVNGTTGDTGCKDVSGGNSSQVPSDGVVR